MYRIYTRTGDKGTTALYGGSRIEKDHIRVEAYGTVDELISQLGVCYATTRDAGLRESLHHIQQTLFVLGAELASDARGLTRLSQTIGEEEITALERLIDRNMAESGPLKQFVIPGRNLASAQLHVARTQSRRLERLLTTARIRCATRSNATAIACRMPCSPWRESKRLGLMLALELAGVNIVLLHFAPQGGAADIEQLRHLLHPPAGHPGGVNNSFLFDGAKSQAGRQQR